MIHGINGNPSEKSSVHQVQETLRIATQNDVKLCSSSITYNGEGIVSNVTGAISSSFNKIWGAFKWILSKVFFCYDCSGILGKSRLEVLKEAKKAALEGKETLKQLCQTHKDRDALINAWRVEFDKFPSELQSRLLETYVIGLAKGKGLTKDEEIQNYVQSRSREADTQALARRYVRDLDYDSDQDPVNEMVDISFDYIEEKLAEEIGKLEGK